MASEAEVRLKKLIDSLQAQVNIQSAEIRKLHRLITHPTMKSLVHQLAVQKDGLGDLLGTANQVTVVNGIGAIAKPSDVTLSLPQNIHSGATPTFVGLLATGVAALDTAAEAWVGPSSTTGVYFKGSNVGIGTVGPDVKLHVTTNDATAVLRLERNDTTIGTDDIVGRIEVEGQDAGAAGICATLEAIAEGNAGETGWRFSTGVAGAIIETMRLTYIGYLGVGVVDPDAQLHVEHVTGAVQRLTRKDTAAAATDIIGRIEFETQDSDSAGVGAFFQAEAEGSAGEVGLIFATGVGGTAVERVRIKNDGVINIASLPSHANNAAALAGGLVAGDLYRTNGDPDTVCIVH